MVGFIKILKINIIKYSFILILVLFNFTSKLILVVKDDYEGIKY